jgi:hypothetical protein
MSTIDRSTTTSTTFQGHYAWHQNLQGIFYGPGCVNTALPGLLETLGLKRAMVLTSKSVLTKVQLLCLIQSYALPV